MSIVKINDVLKVEESIFKVISSESSPIDNTPTYVLYRSPSITDEGTTVTYTLATTNVAEDTLVSYTVTGISQEDLSSGSLTGNFTVGVDGSSTVSFTIANDILTEGIETMTLSAGGQSMDVIINDTSVPSASPQIVIEPGPSIGSFGPLILPRFGSGSFYAAIQSTNPFTYRWKKNGNFVGPTYNSSGGLSPVTV
jgi:hypothetical protein